MVARKWNGPVLPLAFAALLGCTGVVGEAGTDVPGAGGQTGGTGGAGGAGGEGGAGGVTGKPLPGVFVPAPGGLRLLTALEYRNTVRDLLGAGAIVAPEVLADLHIAGVLRSVGAMQLPVLPATAEQLAASAGALAQQVMGDPARREAIVGCRPAGVNDAACARTFVTGFGLRAFRRPLAEAETTLYTALLLKGATDMNDFWGGAETALRAFLQAPQLLYRTELGKPGASPGAPRSLTGYEVAARLSYFLASTTPSPALLDAARRGELDTPEGVRRQAAQLADARAFQALDPLFDEWLHLDELDTATGLSAELRAAMHEETLALLRDVSFANSGATRGLADALTTKEAKVTPALAKHYGLTAPAGAPAAGQVTVPIPDSMPRIGLLGQGSFLAPRTNLIRRAAAIRGELLCDAPPPPPASAQDQPLPAMTMPMTGRVFWTMATSSAQCTGCHQSFNSLGFALENFDALARYRVKDNGLDIDPSGMLYDQAFTDAPDLARKLAASGKFADCFAEVIYEHATGRARGIGAEGQEERIAGLGRRFAERRTNVRELISDLTGDALFLTVGGAR